MAIVRLCTRDILTHINGRMVEHYSTCSSSSKPCPRQIKFEWI